MKMNKDVFLSEQTSNNNSKVFLLFSVLIKYRGTGMIKLVDWLEEAVDRFDRNHSTVAILAVLSMMRRTTFVENATKWKPFGDPFHSIGPKFDVRQYTYKTARQNERRSP